MADKEERIYILSKPLYPSVDGWKDAKEKSMTRQEAINQVVKALEEQCMPKSYIEYVAKIAVDALLEGVKK